MRGLPTSLPYHAIKTCCSMHSPVTISDAIGLNLAIPASLAVIMVECFRISEVVLIHSKEAWSM